MFYKLVILIDLLCFVVVKDQQMLIQISLGYWIGNIVVWINMEFEEFEVKGCNFYYQVDCLFFYVMVFDYFFGEFFFSFVVMWFLIGVVIYVVFFLVVYLLVLLVRKQYLMRKCLINCLDYNNDN